MQHEYCIIVHISPLVMLKARFHTQYSVGTDQVAGEIISLCISMSFLSNDLF